MTVHGQLSRPWAIIQQVQWLSSSFQLQKWSRKSRPPTTNNLCISYWYGRDNGRLPWLVLSSLRTKSCWKCFNVTVSLCPFGASVGFYTNVITVPRIGYIRGAQPLALWCGLWSPALGWRVGKPRLHVPEPPSQSISALSGASTRGSTTAEGVESHKPMCLVLRCLSQAALYQLHSACDSNSWQYL